MEITKIEIDALWVFLATILVFFMQSGFALLETGIHSEKNITNVFMKNIMDFVIASIAFWAVGFAFMFGNGSAYIGSEGWFLSGGQSSFLSLEWANIPLNFKFMFQLVFAGTAATIISGAIGGRVKFTSYLILSILVTAIIYPVLGKWVWGGGIASSLVDFAGSTVVHGVGGFAALAAVINVGPRKNRFSKGSLRSYNVTFAALGTLILWLGWFGFNAGSTMGLIGQIESIGHILLTTNLAASSGALAAVIVAYFSWNKFDLPVTLNGALGGLVSITAGCSMISPANSILIGALAGIIVFYSTLLLERLKIDDVVGAFPVHGLCGIWGTACVGLFAYGEKKGLFYGGDFSFFFNQLGISIGICLLAFISTHFVCKLIKLTIGLRVSDNEEQVGLDISEHHNINFHETVINNQEHQQSLLM